MQIKPGSRLRSAVCSTEAIIVRAATGDVDLRCGGVAMVAANVAVEPGSPPSPDFAAGTQIGKRYASEDLGLEVLVTKAGSGSLSVGDSVLPIKDAKALPSSD